jgi:type I site-specific restriction endonuclease
VAYNEQETRFFLIDRVLWDKGYNSHQRIKMETPAPVEPSGYKGRRRKGSGRVDYLLCVQLPNMPQPLPVGVLEAKHAGEDPLKGMQQAPAPDHAVQKDIVQRVKAALATIDTMEQACKASLKDIEQLPQRILAQAFEQVAA